ncbi:MAG: hypothetical protein IH804_01820 [Planctomycetes bacterium]|nr:hypothetical protein [Planctomycetota bacterium]
MSSPWLRSSRATVPYPSIAASAAPIQPATAAAAKVVTSQAVSAIPASASPQPEAVVLD